MTAIAQPIRFAPGPKVRTAYRQAGSGPVLLLIHGADADHTMFLGLMELLAEHFTVVAYDQRDSGSTDNDGEPYDLADLADDAAALIDLLLDTSTGSSAHVYGSSFGGQIAQVLAARHSHLVDRLVLGSTWRVGRTLADVNAAALGRLAALRVQLPHSAEQIAAFFFSQRFLAAHPQTVELFRKPQRTPEQAGRRARMMQAAPPAIDFARITAPTLLLAGGADRLIPPAETFGIARLVAGARTLELPDLPHGGASEDPAQVAQAIRRFLEAAASGPP